MDASRHSGPGLGHEEFSNGEREVNKTYTVVELAPMGYGNPEAKISLKKFMPQKSVEEMTDEEKAEALLQEAILQEAKRLVESGECMGDIDQPDDGCIDGRLASSMIYPLGIEGEDFNEVEIDEKDMPNHLRSKVAGGGYITTLAMKLALDDDIEFINEDLQGLVFHLAHNGIFCGTHSGDHRHESVAADCGANDRLEEILTTGRDKSDAIGKSINTVLEACDMPDVFDETTPILANAGLRTTLSYPTYFEGSNGDARFHVIMENIAEVQKLLGHNNKPLAVSKHLAGSHNEALIALNTIEGRTLSQAKFHAAMKKEFPDAPDSMIPQVFTIDIPRIVQLANVMKKGRDDEDSAFQVALYSGLSFQFATAATLTDGSLPMFVIKEK